MKKDEPKFDLICELIWVPYFLTLFNRKKGEFEEYKKLNATFEDVQIDHDNDLRGIAVFNGSVWVGGSEGFMMRFKDGGKIHGKVDNGEEYQIRDLALFSDQDILALGSGARARF